MFRELMHTWKNSRDLLLCKRILHVKSLTLPSFVLKETVYEVQNFQNALWVTRMLAVNTSTCQLCT